MQIYRKQSAWKNSYRTNWVLNISIESFRKAENIGAKCEVINENISKTERVLEKIYTE